MRITQQILTNQMLNNLHRNLGRMENVQEQLTTGRKINRPSDDPVGLSSSLRYRSGMAANAQYERNLGTAISWLEQTDMIMGQVVDIMHRAHMLTLQGANESNSQTSRASIAAEVEELMEQLRQTANTDLNGKHIFNGQRTDQDPYPEPDSYLTAEFDQGKIRYEVAKGVIVEVNTLASDIFGEAGEADNIFVVLEQISTALHNEDYDSLNQSIGLLNSRLDTMLVEYAAVGAKSNRLSLIDDRLKDEDINLESLLAKTEAADMAEVLMRLQMEENVYRASLSAGARIIQPSLLDFLR